MIPMMVIAALFGAPALAAEQAPAPTTGKSETTTAPTRRPLDLRPPKITQLYTSEQLNQILAATLRSDMEEVEVEEQRDRMPNTPTPWGGIAAPFWALLNPTQSWRIFAPLPPDQTRGQKFIRVNATDAYLLEPAGVPSPHAQ